jgi:hypothetical protein
MKGLENILYSKSKIVRWAMIVLCALILFLSFRNTFTLGMQYRDLSSAVDNMDASPKMQAAYKADIFEDVDINRIVFDAISETAKANQVIVKTINTPSVFEENDFLVLTEEITLDGDFVKIIKCLDEADAKLEHVKIASMNFVREENQKSTTLLLKVYFQMIKTKAYEAE